MRLTLWESLVAIALALVVGAVVFDENVDPTYMDVEYIAGYNIDKEPKVPLTLTQAEVADLTIITKLHRVFPNMQWQPEWNWDNGERQQTHVLTMSPEAITQICPGAAACTISDLDLGTNGERISDEAIASINEGTDPTTWVFRHSCIIFMPIRQERVARAWFYLLGHEFAHCRYGNFHPGVDTADEAEQGNLPTPEDDNDAPTSSPG